MQLKLQSELHRREGGLESVSSQGERGEGREGGRYIEERDGVENETQIAWFHAAGDSSPVEMGTGQLELVQQFHAVPDSLLLKGTCMYIHVHITTGIK